jgi:hypothetical protein
VHHVNAGQKNPGTHMKRLLKPWVSAMALLTSLLGGCAVYVPDAPVVVPQGGQQGGPGNGFCPPGQAKKGNC